MSRGSETSDPLALILWLAHRPCKDGHSGVGKCCYNIWVCRSCVKYYLVQH